MFEARLLSFLDRLHAVSLNCFVPSSELVESSSSLDAILSQQIRCFVTPSLKATSFHPILSLQVFKKYVSLLDYMDGIKTKSVAGMTQAESRLFSCCHSLCSQFIRVKPWREPTIFDYPKLAIEEPYRFAPYPVFELTLHQRHSKMDH